MYKTLTQTNSVPKHRTATLATLKQPFSDPPRVLDHALTLFFNGPKSYSGEDLLELHVHGGPAVVRVVLESIQQVKSEGEIRYAEPGEFSKRAFYNGKLDLTQIEGIGSIIEAETESQRQAALTSASGMSKALYERWRTEIVENMALLTALIDFSDDNQGLDPAEVLVGAAQTKVRALLAEIRSHLGQIRRSELLLQGITLSLLGPPNAGKSSILNLLARRDAAIVSSEAGTTRDVLEVGLDIAGYKVVLGDTAGIRGDSEAGAIEKEGIRRARMRFQKSDVILAVLPVDFRVSESLSLVDELRTLSDAGKQVVVALNKSDIAESSGAVQATISELSQLIGCSEDTIQPVSCVTGEGMDSLLERLSGGFSSIITSDDGGDPITASQRVKDNLVNTVIPSLERFLDCGLEEVVFSTEELNLAAEGIGMITGQGIGIEEVLGAVFSKFCIGK